MTTEMHARGQSSRVPSLLTDSHRVAVLAAQLPVAASSQSDSELTVYQLTLQGR